MNLFRILGWLLILFGAGFFVGEVYHILIFIIGFLLVVFNPIEKKNVNEQK